jgi:hypothetical protein
MGALVVILDIPTCCPRCSVSDHEAVRQFLNIAYSMGLNPKGRNWGSLVNWDDLGKFYAAAIISWTVVLYAGTAFLIYNRKLAFIKIRNLPLATAAITFLHVYLVKIVLAYTTNGHFPCAAEFWIMSIYLPFGIALFQANLAQLESISDQQQDLVLSRNFHNEKQQDLTLPRRIWYQWMSLRSVQRTYVCIGLGMLVQLVITAILYATTPTLQGDWSSYGKVSHAKGQVLCRKSLQWIPSAFWQLAWSWLYGPYLLFRVRKIHDVHYWRLAIILSVISGLPGTPLWLAAVFSTGFKKVNPWWVPPMWLAPGIFVMQFTTIFFPIYEIFRSRYQMRATLAILESWEDKRQLRDESQPASSRGSNNFASSTSSREIYTMSALEKALNVHPDQLLQFAATRDFTAENILFLMEVRDWRKLWETAPGPVEKIPGHIRARLFQSAVHIYASRVHEKSAEFPINIESKIRQDLDAVFEGAVPPSKLAEEPDSGFQNATSWFKSPPTVKTFRSEDSADSSETRIVGTVLLPKEEPQSIFPPHPGVAPLGEYRTQISSAFNEHVFDAAEDSIKYLVLTNTWQKFVKEHSLSRTVSTEG